MEDQNPNEEIGNAKEQVTIKKHDLAHKLSTTGWALFFIWIGFAFLLNFDFSAGVLGVGIIILVIQVVRKTFGLKFEGFWLFSGFIFLLGGFKEIFGTEFPVIPVLFILAGAVMLASVFRGKWSK
ncbi:hypothetical protein ACFL4T_06025 [candidate division KSB1 bacterium]